MNIRHQQPSEQQGCFGIRKWHSNRGVWLYRTAMYNKEKGHYYSWTRSSSHAWTSTSLLSVMFDAQALAAKSRLSIQVVAFKEDVLWSTHRSCRKLQMEPPKKRA